MRLNFEFLCIPPDGTRTTATHFFLTLGMFEEMGFNSLLPMQNEEQTAHSADAAQGRSIEEQLATSTSTAQKESKDDSAAILNNQQAREEISRQKVALAMSMFNVQTERERPRPQKNEQIQTRASNPERNIIPKGSMRSPQRKDSTINGIKP